MCLWSKLPQGITGDRRLVAAARSCGTPMAVAVGVWAVLHDEAALAHDRGSVAGIDAAVLDASLDLEAGTAERLMEAFRACGLISDGGRISYWDAVQGEARQPNERRAPMSGAERVRRCRARKAAKADAGEPKAEPEAEPAPEVLPEAKAEPEPEQKPALEPEAEPEPEAALEPEVLPEGQAQAEPKGRARCDFSADFKRLKMTAAAQAGFLSFYYGAYPRRVAPRHAVAAYGAALHRLTADGMDEEEAIETIRAAAVRYAEETAGKEARFVAHPSSWLNSGRYYDEPEQGGAEKTSGLTFAAQRAAQNEDAFNAAATMLYGASGGSGDEAEPDGLLALLR